MGKSSINWLFTMAMFNYQRVMPRYHNHLLTKIFQYAKHLALKSVWVIHPENKATWG